MNGSMEVEFVENFNAGVAANVKLLLKLIQDHQIACDQDKNDHRRMLRVATMMTILDNAKDRIQKCQSFGLKRTEPSELRRCNSDLRRNSIPRDKKPSVVPEMEAVEEEADGHKERLRRELIASLAAQRNLKAMCSSLGKEKKFMEAELSKKVHELSEMEELLHSLKAQNETLRQKVQECLSEHKDRKSGGGGSGDMQAALVLQERNKALSEQMLRSIDGYRSMKRKLKVAQEENAMLHSTVDEVGAKVVRSLERVRSLKERMTTSPPPGADPPLDLQEEIIGLESMFERFEMLVEKHEKKRGDCVARPNGEINAYKPSVVA